jgi:predicted phosphoribosyltransferase
VGGNTPAAGHDLPDLIEDAVRGAELALARGTLLVTEVCERIELLLVLLCVAPLHVPWARFCAGHGGGFC